MYKQVLLKAIPKPCQQHIKYSILNIKFLLLFLVLLSSLAQAKYSGGAGTAEEPYKIADYNDLYALADDTNDYNKCFIMTADIDLDPNLPGRRHLTTALISPYPGPAFTGTFDGNDSQLINFTIDTNGAGNDYLGLFGQTDTNAVISNLGVRDVNITSDGGGDLSYFGGLVGWNNQGTISDCYATGSVNGDWYLGGLVGYNSGSITGCYATGSVTGRIHSWYLGGLVGYNYGGSITGCHAESSVSGGMASSYLGGLVGDNPSGSITNSYATGSVTGSNSSWFLGGLAGRNNYGSITGSYAECSVFGGDLSQFLGGLVGYNYDGSIINSFARGTVTGGDSSDYAGGPVGRNYEADIQACYATGAVTGGQLSENLGGLVGENDDYGSVTNCYATGVVTGDSYVGGLVGYMASGSIANCYFLDPNDGGGPDNGYGEPLTDIEMKQQASFLDWDFNGVWAICEGTNYPRLIWSIPAGDFLCPDGVTFIDYSYFADHWLWSDYGDVNGLELSGNGKIENADFALFASWWGQASCGDCGGADYTGDYAVDSADLQILFVDWLETDYGDCEGAELTGDGFVSIDDALTFSNQWLTGL